MFSRFSPDPDDEDHLLIRFRGTNDEILILSSLDGGLDAVEQIRFDDETIMLLTDIRELIDNQILVATEDTDLLAAPNTDLIISANDLLANDIGNGLELLEVYGAENGTVSLDPESDITFVPDVGFTGEASFTYSVKDANGALETANVNITVTPLAGSLPANSVLLTVNDILDDQGNNQGETVSFVSVSNPLGGIVEILPDGRVLFVPDEDFEGAASFDYVIDAGSDAPFTGEHTITIGQVNTAPVVVAEIVDLEINEDNLIEYSIPTDTFTDAETSELDYVATLSDGSTLPDWLSFSPLSQTFFGTPPQDFHGTLNVNVIASDGALQATAGFQIRILNVNDAPIVRSGLMDQQSNENQPINLVVPDDAFFDADGDILSLSAVQADGLELPAWLSFDPQTKTFSGNPPLNFTGALNIRIIASDGEFEVSDTFELEIVSANDAPIVSNPIADQSSEEDKSISFTLPADTFSDIDGDTLSVSALLADGSELPAWLSFDAAAGSFSGTPPQDFNGTLSVTVTASDGEFEASDTFDLEITPVNDAPVANADFGGLLENNSAQFNILDDDFDVDGDPLSIVAFNGQAVSRGDQINLPSSAYLEILKTGIAFYTNGAYEELAEGERLTENFTYTISDGNGGTSTADFTFWVFGENDAPVVANAVPHQFGTEDETINYTIPANTFSDVDSDDLTLTATLNGGTPLPAWLSFDSDTGTYTGNPPQNFRNSTLIATVEVTATDPDGESIGSVFSFNITTINDAPIVVTPLIDRTSTEDQSVSFSIPAETFSDVDDADLTLTATLAGGAVLPAWLSFDAAARTFTGTPPQDFNGTLSVTVTASDGEFEASDTFDLEITPVNDAPEVTNAIADQTSAEDAAVSFALPEDTFSDIDGDALTLSARLVSGAALPAWLTFDVAAREFSGTPPQDFNGTLSVEVIASDGELEASDTFDLEITPVNDAPEVANAISDQTSDEDTEVSFALPADTFSDIDGDALTLSARLASGATLPAWLVFDAAAREFNGTPPQNFNGTLSVEIIASDGELEASDTFDLEITPVNDAPEVANAIADQTSAEDAAVSFTLPANTFSDIDGDILSVSARLADGSELPAWLSFDAAARTFSGTPPQDFNGALSVTVTASDGELEASDTFDLEISPVNDAPVANDDTGLAATAGETATISAIGLLANDDDIDGDALEITGVSSTSGNATVALDGDGNITYTANDGFEGTDTFEYTVSDGDLEATATVTIAVDGSGDPYEGWVQGTDGRDWIFGDLFSSNQIYGAGGNDRLFGGFYSDQIDGGTGNDRIYGLWGDDILNGNEGNDRLWGGWGQDTFVFSEGDGRDRIMDFDTGQRPWWWGYRSGGDKISINMDGVDSYDDLMDVASQQGRHTVFDFGDGDKLILSYTRLAALDQDAFTFF